MTIPSSFCTICTSPCAFELIGLLLSLSIYHTNEKIYIMCDSKTKKIIENMTPTPKINIIWFVELDKYDGMNRSIMVEKNLWSEFQMSKANIIKLALKNEKDTLFLDSDIIIINRIDDIDLTKSIGISPQFISKKYIKETGFYNGGVLWTNTIDVANDWIEFTKTSRYYDQASIEDLARKYKYNYFLFDENYNLQCWRYYLSPLGKQTIASYITSNPNIHNIYYKNKPLKFIHTHFLDNRFKEFNSLIINHLNNAKMYKILAIIYRVIHNKWILRMPKQPIKGLGYHNNDSYRELLLLMKTKNTDVEIVYDINTIHCWLQPNILTYDRPTLEWCNQELNNASLLLLGNGDINIEGNILKKNYSNIIVKPWIFWGRKPIIIENILNDKGILSFEQRNIESIFIGNFENSVQEKYRITSDNWSSVISEYYCIKGKKHLYNNEEYLLKLREAKYGLCLRGYGSKCHREVELMAFGTVPIITPNVSIKSYLEPLIENVHYLYIDRPDKIKDKLSSISPEKWTNMSNECYKWYQKNIHSNNCWKNMIEYILYD
jgi:hypothetical protein